MHLLLITSLRGFLGMFFWSDTSPSQKVAPGLDVESLLIYLGGAAALNDRYLDRSALLSLRLLLASSVGLGHILNYSEGQLYNLIG